MQHIQDIQLISYPLSCQQRRVLMIASLVFLDMFAIALAYWLAFQTRFNLMFYPNPVDISEYQRFAFYTIPAWLLIFAAYQLYSTRILFGGLEEYSRLFNAILLGAVFVIFLNFWWRRDDEVSRLWLIYFCLFSLLLAVLFRYTFRRLIYYLRRRGHLLSPALIVGANEEGRSLYEGLRRWDVSGLYVLGFIDDAFPLGHSVIGDSTVIGNMEDLQVLVENHHVEDIIISSNSINRQEQLQLFAAMSWHPQVKIHLSSGVFEIISTGMHIKQLSHIPLIEINKTRITGIDLVLKTTLDYLVAISALIFLFPVFLIIAIIIRLDSPGPIFYRHPVLGLNGEGFKAFKFRTMYQDCHKILEANPGLKAEFLKNYKLKDDPRVTRVGRFLRSSSLDELPQLLDIFAGRMSVIGPRYITPREMEMYGRKRMNLHTVKPGITGLWQVSGRSNTTYEERVRLDMYYIRNYSIWLDLYILLKTIPAVLKREGAY